MVEIMTTVAPATSYPMSKRQLAYMTELIEQSTKALFDKIAEIRAACVKECSSNTNACSKHSREINKAWEQHYTYAPVGTWTGLRGEQFVDEINKLFAKDTPIEQIHQRVAKEYRAHIHDNLCTPTPTDDDSVKKLRLEADDMFAAGASEKDIQMFFNTKHEEYLNKLDPVQAEIQLQYQAADSDEERYPIIRKWHCVPRGNDTPSMLKLRSKWDELFANGVTYSQISATIAKDIEAGVKAAKVLEDKLKDLMMGQTAQAKIKASKDDKKAERDEALKLYLYSNATSRCSGPGCANLAIPINDNGDQIRCPICAWLENEKHIEDAGAFCSSDCEQRLGVSPESLSYSTQLTVVAGPFT